MLVRRRDYDKLLEQIEELSEAKHETELRLIRAETLAEERRYMIERLERALDDVGMPSGGFVAPQVEQDQPEPTTADSLLDRLDEICGTGLSLDELEARHDAYRRKQIENLEKERRAILEELNGST